MNIKSKSQWMTLTSLLTALAIVIPLIMPVKVVIPPASYTLASHVPIFLALFISPLMTVVVILGSTFGFFIAGYPFVIVLRAFSHIFFGFFGALYLKKHPQTLNKALSTWTFNIVLALIHALAEVLVTYLFYSVEPFQNGSLLYFLTVFIGFGTIVHSIVDFAIADFIYKALQKIR